MDENNIQNAVAASETNAVLKDLRTWLKANIDWLSDKKITISGLDLDNDSFAIVPIKGIRKRRQYACGGYQVYMPFMLWYRTAAEGNSSVEAAFNSMDSIGIALDSLDFTNMLSGDRQVDSFYQDTSTVLQARKGSITDFTTNFVLIYSV